MTIKTELMDSLIVAKKEFKVLFRKKWLVIPLFLFPIIMIVFFGYGMGGTVKNSPILIVNDDTGRASNSLIQEIGSYTPKYDANPMFSVTYTKDMSQSEAESKINDGIYKGVLLIPNNYSDSIAKNESTSLTLLTDSSDTATSQTIINFIRQLLSKTGSVILNIPNIYGNLEYLDFLTPGVIALNFHRRGGHPRDRSRPAGSARRGGHGRTRPCTGSEEPAAVHQGILTHPGRRRLRCGCPDQGRLPTGPDRRRPGWHRYRNPSVRCRGGPARRPGRTRPRTRAHPGSRDRCDDVSRRRVPPPTSRCCSPTITVRRWSSRWAARPPSTSSSTEAAATPTRRRS